MNRVIRVLLIADMWATFALGMIGPIYAIFVERIGGDILDASWAYFAFMLTSGVMMYLIGRWEDRVKHKRKLIIAGYSLTALGCLSYYFVQGQGTLVMTQIILGLAEAVMVPSYDAIYSRALDRKKEASEWADWEAMRYIVTALAALAGGYVVYLIGFRTLFLIMFAISLLSIPSAMMLKD